jgi:glycosyltransferase involved in cell wall biosynthesis
MLHRSLVRKIFRHAAVVTNVSQAFGKKIKDLFGLRAAEVINNTVDTSMFQFKPQDSRVFRFIHVSSLEDVHKNVTGILKAIKTLSTRRTDFEIVIAGPQSESLLLLSRQLGIERLVVFTGEITYEQVSAQMKNASVFVLFSWYENSPCVIGEALCCGLPVIASDTGGISELVNASNGILIIPGDIDTLSRAMENAIDNYSNYDRQLIASNAAEKFCFATIGKKIADLYTVERLA